MLYVVTMLGTVMQAVEYSYVHVDREQEDYVSLSFSTISAVGSNAAVIHYRFITDQSPLLVLIHYMVLTKNLYLVS